MVMEHREKKLIVNDEVENHLSSMEVEKCLSSCSKKRELWHGEQRLNDKVEVRSMEELFLGSRHPGTVVTCEKLKRHVEYDNLVHEARETETKSWLEAVLEYYLAPEQRGNREDTRSLRREAKKHLIVEGWKTEHLPLGQTRTYYISPQNKRFQSLRTACKGYIKENIPKWISSGMIPLNSSSVNEDNSGLANDDSFLFLVYKLLQREPELFGEYGAHMSRSVEVCEPKCSRELKSQDNLRWVYTTIDCSDSFATNPPPRPNKVEFERKYCPGAVLRYYSSYSLKNTSRNFKKDMILEARKHLSAEGWSFHLPVKQQGMIYFSPRMRRYASLQSACEACIRECLPKWIKYDIKVVDGLDIDEERIGQLDSHQLSDYVSELLSKNPEMPASKRIPERRSTGHCMSNPPRNRNSDSPKNWLLRSSTRLQNKHAPCPSNMKAQNVLSWLIDCNMWLLNSKVCYHARGACRARSEGQVTRDGIKCFCCHQLYGINSFGSHATGQRNCRSAAANIVLENGKSLLDLQRQVMNEHRTGETTASPWKSERREDNDDICTVCQDGGELILCDNCTSSFHQSCIGLEDIPEGDWFCPTCCCEICCQRKTEGDDDEKLFTCSQCEHKYHAKCLGKRSEAMSGRYVNSWFCGESCERIYAGLHRLIGEPIAVGVDNLKWTLLKCVDPENCDIKNGRNDLEEEIYSKLNAALAVMHKCFEPIVDPHTGRDLVEDVFFSRRSEVDQSNFHGFYTVILEKDGEVVTVANIRVHGVKVVEVPFVGTALQHRGKGLCRVIMNELEKRLSQLGVEKIVLPSCQSALNTWTSSFGFKEMTNSERSQFLDCTFLDFPGTIMCQKRLIQTTTPTPILSTEKHTKTFDHQYSAVSEDQENINKNKRRKLNLEGRSPLKLHNRLG